MAYFAGAPVMLAFASILWFGLVAGLTSTLQQVINFGINPTNIGMFVYTPTNVTANPAVIVAIHECNGTAQTYFSSSPYAQFADTYGFIVIYPSSPNADTCWDVSSPATLTHDGGGDSQGIASMVDYAILTYGADPTRIFVTGTASGAMMTNVLCAVYPELWRAATSYAGAAAGCFVDISSEFPNYQDCTVDGAQEDGDYWAAVARAMYPDYTGTYPPIQVWYGDIPEWATSEAAVSQWAAIFGYDTNNPQSQEFSAYEKFLYGPSLQVLFYFDAGAIAIPIQGNEDMAWFGIDTSLAPPPIPPSPPPPVPHWGQCGGIGWTGETTCAAPYTCVEQNPYHYQCL
ncbi:Carbohydrate esterase family 1 and carbohydrate-binding module family 1 protein [Mycena venus]|uniref:Carboxylic ester hydrolase n=1 Tax=Mycena venus TaxID=2733690 RepID=A0A8H6XYK7_9AGAR|nr:Carbohydrate esterase family 1 and carbohydrate-binding module family 1 protein [Mycena venus]